MNDFLNNQLPSPTSPTDDFLDSRLEGCISRCPRLAQPGTFGKKPNTAMTHFLNHMGIVQIETLQHTNNVAPAGMCQFSSVCHQLFGGALSSPTFRPATILRALVCDYLHLHADYFTPFLIARRERSAKARRNGGVLSMDTFLATMSKDTSDGNAMTLQAISDITRTTINVIKATQKGAITVLPPVLPRARTELNPQWTETKWQVPGRMLWLTLVGEGNFLVAKL